ncbi:Clr5 domain-containing protein isoform 1 [Cladophialophora immunda]|nr:Clr5 domain-containing protein isoform 1 [Cladophialophora immunda]
MALSLGNPRGWTVENVAAPAPAPAPASTQAPASASALLEAREGPAPAQWQAVKEEIRILYEKHPLRDVRRILLDRHNFRATERMYKARLSQWGISKNYSDKDYQICAVLHHTRQKSGKRSTAFVIHGHKRSLKDLNKYIKGRKMTEEDFLASALANVKCSTAADQQQEQYAHVRAYTPEPEAEAEEAPPPSSAPRGRPPAEIAANVPSAKDSPRGAASESVSSVPGPGPGPASCSTAPTSAFAHQHSPTSPSQRWSPHHAASPYLPLAVSPPQRHGPYFPSKESTTTTTYSSDASPSSSSRAHAVSSPQDAPLSAALSYTYPAPYEPLATVEDQVRHAGTVYDTSPVMTCNQLGRDVEYMALQLVDAPPLKSLCGHDDIRSWALLFADSSSEDSMDYEQICPTCHESTREHFISLPNLEMPQLPRNILNATQDLPESTISIPASSRGHEHSWKWVARCFAACIYLRRGNHTLSQRSLADADAEFKKMLVPRQDPKVLLALNQTLQILQMHDQGDITKTIMQSAYLVAERLLGPSHPLTTIVRWMVYVANGQMRNHDITSETLRGVHEQFVQHYGQEDPRAIASKYCYGFMLNVEWKLQEAEQVLREVYKVSSTALGPKHLQSISALTNLHRSLERQNRIDEAVSVLRCAIRDSKDTLGDNHPRRLESLRLLALLYKQQGHLDLTEELYWQVLEGRVKMLGKNHTFTQGMKRDLEDLLKERGKWTVEERRPGKRGDGSVEVVVAESNSQLRLQDLFEWDVHEQWDDARSDGGSSETGSDHAAF